MVSFTESSAHHVSEPNWKFTGEEDGQSQDLLAESTVRFSTEGRALKCGRNASAEGMVCADERKLALEAASAAVDKVFEVVYQDVEAAAGVVEGAASLYVDAEGVECESVNTSLSSIVERASPVLLVLVAEVSCVIVTS